MIKLKTIRERYKTDVACAQALGIWPSTLARLLRLNALLSDSGAIYIESQTMVKPEVAKEFVR